MEADQMTDNFEDVFAALKSVMQQHTVGLKPTSDEPGKYYLATEPLPGMNKPFWFGGVEIKKNYVSYHLMAVYCCPKLLSTLSPELKARMQGKSCFNFKKVDPALFAELGELTRSGQEALKTMDFSKFQGSC